MLLLLLLLSLPALCLPLLQRHAVEGEACGLQRRQLAVALLRVGAGAGGASHLRCDRADAHAGWLAGGQANQC